MNAARRQRFSPRAHDRIAISIQVLLSHQLAILLIGPGCRNRAFEIEDTRQQQDAVFYLDPGFAIAAVVDQSGNKVRLSDGMQLVMDNSAFERVILPSVAGERRGGMFDKHYIRVDARFRIVRENLVVGVVQSDDGGAEEVGRDYWVLKIDTIRGAEWCPPNGTVE